MTTSVRVCPLCGSSNIVIHQPDTLQRRAGVSLVLKCECGAVVTMSVLKPSDNVPDECQPTPAD